MTITTLDQLSSILESSDADFFYKKNGTEFRFTKSEILSTSLFQLIRLINDKNLYQK